MGCTFLIRLLMLNTYKADLPSFHCMYAHMRNEIYVILTDKLLIDLNSETWLETSLRTRKWRQTCHILTRAFISLCFNSRWMCCTLVQLTLLWSNAYIQTRFDKYTPLSTLTFGRFMPLQKMAWQKKNYATSDIKWPKTPGSFFISKHVPKREQANALFFFQTEAERRRR